MHVGQHGLYRVTEGQVAKTVRGKIETLGSVHHPEMMEFFAVVGRVHPAVKAKKATEETEAVEAVPERADVALTVPGKDKIVWVNGVLEGSDAGEFEPEGHLPEEDA